ncbi:hypothetical protein [Cellulomonas sp. URHB0016]
MPESERSAWKAVARTLVLHDRDGRWRYAVYSDEGVVDGVLRTGGSGEVAPAEAQARLLAEVEELTGRRYVATWTQDEPHVWSADLLVTP